MIAGGTNGVSRLAWNLTGASAQPLSLPGRAPVQHGFMLATFESDRFRVWDIRSAKIGVSARGADRSRAGRARERQLQRRWQPPARSDRACARLWDLPSGNEFPRLAEARLAESSRDGSRILCTDKTAKIWDAESGRLLHEIKPAEGAVRHQVRKDRLAQEYATYLQTGEKYIHYLSLCLDDPKLNGFEVLPSDKEACATGLDIQKLALFSVLIATQSRGKQPTIR